MRTAKARLKSKYDCSSSTFGWVKKFVRSRENFSQSIRSVNIGPNKRNKRRAWNQIGCLLRTTFNKHPRCEWSRIESKKTKRNDERRFCSNGKSIPTENEIERKKIRHWKMFWNQIYRVHRRRIDRFFYSIETLNRVENKSKRCHVRSNFASFRREIVRCSKDREATFHRRLILTEKKKNKIFLWNQNRSFWRRVTLTRRTSLMIWIRRDNGKRHVNKPNKRPKRSQPPDRRRSGEISKICWRYLVPIDERRKFKMIDKYSSLVFANWWRSNAEEEKMIENKTNSNVIYALISLKSNLELRLEDLLNDIDD